MCYRHRRCFRLPSHALGVLRRLGLTPSQLQAVKSELPDGADPTKFDLLRNFDAAVLGECGLKRVQIATWADLISRTPKDW